MSETNPPPVAPVEGHYAMLKDGTVVGPLQKTSPNSWGVLGAHGPGNFWWDDNGFDLEDYNKTNIIATISPADMQAVAGGGLERLKEALELAIAANAKMKDALSFYADDGPTPNVDGPWKATSWDFGTVARCALADVANIEGGKNP